MAKSKKEKKDTSKENSKIAYLATEGIFALGILEKLELKKDIIDNPVINSFSSVNIYKLYYTNIFLQDLLDNFNKDDLDKTTLYTKVPVFFQFYLTTFEYVISKREEIKKEIDTEEIKKIFEKISKLNNYIISAISNKKGNIRYINLMMNIIAEKIKNNSEDIAKFIEKFNIVITLPDIADIVKEFTFINKTFYSAVKIDDNIIYPLIKKNYFSLKRIFPISINEILLDQRFKENDEIDYSKLTQYFLGLNLFDEVKNQNSEDNEKTLVNNDEFNEIIKFLTDKIMDFEKKETPTEEFFYILDRYNKTLKTFFTTNNMFFTKEEITFIYKEIITKITLEFFDEKILNNIELM